MKSLSNNFDSLPHASSWLEALKCRPLLVAFDRDGTLVPICDHPAEAIPAKEVTLSIAKLSNIPEVATAIVSARSVSNLSLDFDNGKTILAGNYGLEIKFPDKSNYLHPEADRRRNDIAHIKSTLKSLIPQETKVIVDDNVYSLCLHWHLTPDSQRASVHTIVEGLKNQFSQLLWRQGPTSYEILPNTSWTKANALALIYQYLTKRMKPELSIYFGDSEHDEHAFQWINAISGISVRVGYEPKSEASLRMPAPVYVHDFVNALIQMRQGKALPVSSIS